MKHQIKEDWIINNGNVFKFSKDISLSLSSIQYEILNQLENQKINSIFDYLGIEIDITKEIRLTKSLTIRKIFNEFLGFDNINPLGNSNFRCSLILQYLQLSLLKEYSNEKHKNILTFSEYEKQYSTLLNSFLSTNVDTDEKDFIVTELSICENLIIELNKPIYNLISPFNEILDKPSDFKKNLINSIDKRKKYLEKKENETTPKVKALFKFIDFLNSNIENFKKYDTIINELNSLDSERKRLSPNKNFKDKLNYDEIQAVIQVKFKVINENIINPIQDKVTELNICDINKTETLWNWNISEICELKENFSQKDLSEIFRHKRKYLEYRTKTNCNYFQDFFFDHLDEILKVLFDYFKETDHNEFEPFETKTIQIDSIDEFVKGIGQGHSKFSLSTSFLNIPNIQQQNNAESFQPQQNETNLLNINIAQLLKEKEELKFLIERAKEKIIAQEKQILTHKQRAKDGLENTLAFEQKQLPLYLSELKKIQTEYSNIKIRLEALKYKNNIEKEPQQNQTNKPYGIIDKHPKHNPNLWNTECFDLFKYLFDEYYTGTKRQLTNIWFYLKEYQSEKYTLNATKDLYKDFVKKNYTIALTNFDKAQQKWEDKEYKKINEHRQNYEDGLK